MKKRILTILLNKTPAVAIAACVVALFTMGSLPSVSAITPTPVTITGVFDFSTFPNLSGTFTTTGALTISGPATMHIDPIVPGTVAHCVVTLIPSDNSGTIVIDQQCHFDTSPPAGRWEIVSGTGAYANLQGNGSLTMPPNTEAMTGVIFH